MKNIILVLSLMLITQNAFSRVKCNLLQDSELKSHCNKMEKIEEDIEKLDFPDSASNLSFLLFDRDVEMINQQEMELLREKARNSDKQEFENKLESLKQKRLLYFKAFLIRKRQIKELNESTAKRNSIYGLVEHKETRPKKKNKPQKFKYTHDPQYGWVQTLVW